MWWPICCEAKRHQSERPCGDGCAAQAERGGRPDRCFFLATGCNPSVFNPLSVIPPSTTHAFFVLRCDYPESRHRVYRASSDGWSNRDLNVAPSSRSHPTFSHSQPVGCLASNCLNGAQQLGPWQIHAELILDGKACQSDANHGRVVTGTNVSGATLIPPAFDWAASTCIPDWMGIRTALDAFRRQPRNARHRPILGSAPE
jgi:hypothetical protein